MKKKGIQGEGWKEKNFTYLFLWCKSGGDKGRLGNRRRRGAGGERAILEQLFKRSIAERKARPFVTCGTKKT